MSRSFFIRSANKYQRIRIEDIQYVGEMGGQLIIKTPDNQFFLEESISHFIKRNPLPAFVQVSKSYMVNIAFVDEFDEKCITIGQLQIPIEQPYRKNLLKCISSI